MLGDPRDLHVLTHSFPTRRSSDLHKARPARKRPGRESSSRWENAAFEWSVRQPLLTVRLLAELAEKAAYLVADGLVRGRCLTGWLIIGFDRLRLRNEIGRAHV